MAPDTLTPSTEAAAVPRIVRGSISVGVLVGLGVILLQGGSGGLTARAVTLDLAPGSQIGERYGDVGVVFLGLGAFLLAAAVLLRRVVSSWGVVAATALLVQVPGGIFFGALFFEVARALA